MFSLVLTQASNHQHSLTHLLAELEAKKTKQNKAKPITFKLNFKRDKTYIPLDCFVQCIDPTAAAFCNVHPPETLSGLFTFHTKHTKTHSTNDKSNKCCHASVSISETKMQYSEVHRPGRFVHCTALHLRQLYQRVYGEKRNSKSDCHTILEKFQKKLTNRDRV